MIIRRGKLWRKIEERHGAPRYPLPAVVAPTLVERYRKTLLPVVPQPNPLVSAYVRFVEKLKRGSLQRSVTAAACLEFMVTKDELLGPRRKHALPRQVAMHVLSKHTGRNTRQVARVFNKDHTCVIHANRKIERLAAVDSHLAAQIRRIESYIAA